MLHRRKHRESKIKIGNRGKDRVCFCVGKRSVFLPEANNSKRNKCSNGECAVRISRIDQNERKDYH